MKIGETVWFEHQEKIVSGVIVAIDREDPEALDYVVQRGAKIHFVYHGMIIGTSVEVGSAIVEKLRKRRAELRREITRKQDELDGIDDQILKLISAIK